MATLILFISLFMPWFGASIFFFGVGGSATVNGLWHGYMYLTLILSVAIIAYLVVRAGSQQLMNLSAGRNGDLLLASAAGVNLLLAVISFATKPGGDVVGWEYGAYLGLVAAVVALAAPVTSMVALRTRNLAHR